MKKDIFITAIKEIIGKNCWDIIGGSGCTGTWINVKIGDKIERTTEIQEFLQKNLKLLNRNTNYDSKYSIFINDAVWRIDSDEKIILGCWSCGTEHSRRCLEKLIGKKIVNVKVLFPGMDLIVEFENHLYLKIFCDQTNEFDNKDNYSFRILKKYYTVSTGSKIIIEDCANKKKG